LAYFYGQGKGVEADPVEAYKWLETAKSSASGDLVLSKLKAELEATLKRLGLDENTLVIFMSDNGPFLSYGEHAGSALPLREGKLTVFEGGVRVPCLARWPGRVPAGRVSATPFMALDWLPTFTELVGGKAPLQIGAADDRLVGGDGHDVKDFRHDTTNPFLSGTVGDRPPVAVKASASEGEDTPTRLDLPRPPAR
jgi:hypothetical protein